MAQRIIIIHGRSTKLAKARLSALQRKALLHGLERVSSSKAAKVANGTVEIDFVYYGDVNNRILSDTSAKHRKSLTERDPHSDGAPCLPDAGYAEATDALAKIKRFDKRAYKKVLRDNDDFRFIDDAARAVSTISAITTATFLNEWVIKKATADMGAYLMTRSVGSMVRERLQEPLRKAL